MPCALPAVFSAEEVLVEHVVPAPLSAPAPAAAAPPLDEELPEARVQVEEEALHAARAQFFGQRRRSVVG